MAKKENQIITITSDWGIKGYYLAVVKGQLLSCCPEATVVDISHSIQPFNTSEAAFVLKNSFLHFPKNTWHVIEVSTDTPSDAPYLIVNYREHFFIGRDDGVFSLILEDDELDGIFEINDPPETLFPMRDIYVPVLAQLLQGVDIQNIARSVSSIRKKMPFKPTVSGNIVKGQVVYVDNYENIFTNIHRNIFDKARQNAVRFTVYVGGGYSRYDGLKISNNFQRVSDGDIVTFFVNDYLVIAIKHGCAAGLLGGNEGDTVMVEF
ncbi:MAG: SAM-dependent chlorinase/fluorinase [Bacteroidales bacterium]|nr:SAM-dependent chlorinase/fluorinase [Bacteroidales bacterium]